jgi:RNA polymerase sigma-70 factor (ECF subfamily)
MAAAPQINVLDAKRDLDRLLKTGPGRHRMPIVHAKLFGRSVAETATATGLTESAVKIVVHRGLKALAARIRGEKHED